MINVALVPAAGSGERFGGEKSKQYVLLFNEPVLIHTLKVLESVDEISSIIVVVPQHDIDYAREMILNRDSLKKVGYIVPGGKMRQDSVYQGMQYVPDNTDILVIHDGVRPLVTEKIIKEAIIYAKEFGCAVCGIPARETIKRISHEKFVEATLDRNKIWLIQTPQAFRYAIIKEAYINAFNEGIYGTDDSALVERLGYNVKIFMGEFENIKITTPGDLRIAETILGTRI